MGVGGCEGLQLVGNVCVYGVCVCVPVERWDRVAGWRGWSRATDVFAHNAWIRPCCCKQDV